MSLYGYRRGSIFWALTLIAVGVVFLWQNFDPSVHPWQIIAKFWPVLIIFWGLSKLVGYLQAQAHPEAIAPPLFTASEVILLILILITGTLISKLVLLPGPQWMGIHVEDGDLANLFLNPYTYTQTLSRAAQPQMRLLAVDRRGDVEVHASDQPMLDAVVKKTIWASSEAEARKLSEELKIEIGEQAGRSLLQTNLDSLPNSGRNVRLDITLRVPKETSAEVTTERGDIILDGLKGEETLSVTGGDAHITNVDGLVRIHKARGLTEVHDLKGSLELEGRGGEIDVAGVTGTVGVNGEFNGSLQFRNIGQTLRFNSSRTDMTAQKLTGRLSMEVGSLEVSGIDGPFEISTRQKDVTLNDFRHSVKITDDNGEVELRASGPPTHPIEVNLRKGQIELTLPPTSSFQIEANSRRGEVECDFAGPALKVVKEGENASITGTYGKGGPLIRLGTEYGAIRLLRQGLHAPSPPAPPSSPGKVETTTWPIEARTIR
jgi:DUF4097 and DUF4098 domain-containing protein YvlB